MQGADVAQPGHVAASAGAAYAIGGSGLLPALQAQLRLGAAPRTELAVRAELGITAGAYAKVLAYDGETFKLAPLAGYQLSTTLEDIMGAPIVASYETGHFALISATRLGDAHELLLAPTADYGTRTDRRTMKGHEWGAVGLIVGVRFLATPRFIPVLECGVLYAATGPSESRLRAGLEDEGVSATSDGHSHDLHRGDINLRCGVSLTFGKQHLKQ